MKKSFTLIMAESPYLVLADVYICIILRRVSKMQYIFCLQIYTFLLSFIFFVDEVSDSVSGRLKESFLSFSEALNYSHS